MPSDVAAYLLGAGFHCPKNRGTFESDREQDVDRNMGKLNRRNIARTLKVGRDCAGQDVDRNMGKLNQDERLNYPDSWLGYLNSEYWSKLCYERTTE